jgi:MFS family permease
MASQVHPDGRTGKEGLKDEEAPPPSQESHLSGLTAAQIELKTSSRTRTISAAIMLSFCFFDLLGAILFMPTFGALAQRAKNGPTTALGQMLLYPTGALETEELAPFVSPELLLVHKELDALIPCSGAPPEMDTDMVYPLPPWGMCTTAAGEATPSKEDGCMAPSSWSADPAPQLCLLREAHTPASAEQLAWSRTGNPKAFRTTPFGFSTSMNMILVLQSILGGGSMMLWGRVADVMPLKILCHINLMGTLCAYVLMYVAGNYWNSFWGFTAGIVLNGCCGGVGVFAPLYFKKVFPPEEGQFWFGMMTFISMAGGGVGALIMMPFAAGRGENVFNAAWIGIAGTSLVWILLTVYVVEPKKSAKEDKINETLEAEKEKKTPRTPALVNKILWVLIVAMAFDAAGDEGTRIARGTILQNLFAETNRVSFQNILLATMIAMVIVAMLLTALTSTFIGKPMTAVVGAVATVVTQVTSTLASFL